LLFPNPNLPIRFVIPTEAKRSGGTRCRSFRQYDPRVDREFFVYIMSSKSRTIYTGITNNLPGRVGQHKDAHFDSFTAQYHCTRLVWYERHKYVNNALRREKQIKRWRREKKVFLIEQINPTWEDLAEKWWHVPVFLGHTKPAEDE
jgi:putative endonuclease